MNMPGYCKVMIVSHDLRQVLLLDNFGDGFTIDEFDNVKYSYSGYNVSTWMNRLQTDGWDCGVWVAWVASLLTTHVEQGLECTLDVNEVIQNGLSAEGIRDITIHPSGKLHNEYSILQVRRRFRRRIYDDSHPAHLTAWLDHWNTPLQDVQAVSTVTHLSRIRHTAGTTTSQQVDFTEDANDTDSTDPPPPPGGSGSGGIRIRGDPGHWPVLNPIWGREGSAPGPTGAP
jgi:hypothetical protein